MTRKETHKHAASGSIDAYLQAVEQALVRARATRTEREQIRMDLESQFAEMTASDELSIESILDRLGSPDHFAEIYAEESRASGSDTRISPWVAAASVVLAMNVLMLATAVTLGVVGLMRGPTLASFAMLLFLSCVAGALFVPMALRSGYRQLRAQPEVYRGSSLLTLSASAYVVVVPVAILTLLCFVTRGYILFPVAVLAIIYALFRIVSRMRRQLTMSLPKDAARQVNQSDSADTNMSGATESVSSLDWLKESRLF